MTQCKILVVDDNADIRELLEILLTSEGYDVTLASSGEQALQLLHPELDLVILDIMMPGMSGIRVCEQCPRTLSHRKGAGRGYFSWAASRCRRLPAKTVLPYPTHGAGQEPAAAVPGVSGQGRPGG